MLLRFSFGTILFLLCLNYTIYDLINQFKFTRGTKDEKKIKFHYTNGHDEAKKSHTKEANSPKISN